MFKKINIFILVFLFPVFLFASEVEKFQWEINNDMAGEVNDGLILNLPLNSEIGKGGHIKAAHMQSFKNALIDLNERISDKNFSWISILTFVITILNSIILFVFWKKRK